MASITSTKTTSVLHQFFSRTGLPERIVSDNDPQFTCEEFQQFLRSQGIKHHRSAQFHTAKNGLAKWFVQCKTSPCAAGPKDNQKRLDRFLLSYLSSPHSTTKETPFVLFMGRCLRSALDLPKPDVAGSVADSQSAQMSSREKKRSLGILLLDSRCLFVIINLVVRRG